jgi:hypothetical protein
MASEHAQEQEQKVIQLPAPTAWPMVLAFAITLVFAGIVTNGMISIVGAVLLVRAAIGWWYEVLPHEHHEAVELERPHLEEAAATRPVTKRVERLQAGEAGHRVRIPAEIKPYSSGIKGGIVGAVAMAAVAMLFGLISQGSIWYPINLLAAAVLPDLANASIEQLRQFNAVAIGLGVVIHGLTSILVGVLYAVMLPMFPKNAFWWAGIISPILWSGLIASTLELVNPALNARIDWRWFVASQLAFGLTGGYVIARSQSIETMQNWTLAMRAGIEAPGNIQHGEDEK